MINRARLSIIYFTEFLPSPHIMITKTAPVLLFIVFAGAVQRRADPETSVESAKIRIYRDFVKNLYGAIGDAQVNNMYNMIHMYSQSTLEQAQQVVEYIETHSNQTRSESQTLRMASNASVEISACVQRGELNLLQAFKTTGFNLQSCIRSTQLGYEKSYTELSAKLDVLKAKALAEYRRYATILDNCVDSDCIMKTLIQSVVQYETLREELAQEVMAGNNLNSRYIVNSIALGCVSSSIQQINSNYNVGKELMARCFHVTKTENQNKHPPNHNQHQQPNESQTHELNSNQHQHPYQNQYQQHDRNQYQQSNQNQPQQSNQNQQQTSGNYTVAETQTQPQTQSKRFWAWG